MKFERNRPRSLATNTTWSTDMMKHAFRNHERNRPGSLATNNRYDEICFSKSLFRNLPQKETPLPLSSTTRRIRDGSVMHVTYPTGDDRSVLSGKTLMNKTHFTCRRPYPPVTLWNTITTWTLMGIRTEAGYEKPAYG